MQIPVISIDPSLTNVGLVRAMVDLDTSKITIEKIRLVETEKTKIKVVRRNSDDVRRATESLKAIYQEMGCLGPAEHQRPAVVAFAEVPVGSQSSRAMCSYGICCALLAAVACKAHLIQVQPTEVKMAAVGTKTASKEEMIEWASGLYPDLDWKRYEKASKNHAVGEVHADMEHVADAIAAIHAGVLTDEFQRMVAVWRFSPAAA
jgi:Holliday junction resolvasome RuvABC endonuclease subunit